MFITAIVSLLALGSAVALAQQAPPETVSEAPPVVAETLPAAPLPSPENPPPSPPSDAGPVEDAPVDVPTPTRSDWAPDINLDAQNQAGAMPSTPQRRAKPRKILSDAGENALGTGSWSQAGASETAQAQLLARSNRRERAIDPIKRSDLTKLSRVMGALHALRVSCSGRDDQTYRSRMATLLDLEAPDSGELRDPLVDAFNGGFQTYGRGASACPSDSRAQEASLAKDGFALAKTMSARYRPAPKVTVALPPATQPRVNVTAKATPPTAPTAPNTGSRAPEPASNRPNWGNATPN
jgi:uncharacterized protein (TIGR02301 family)